MVLEDKSKVPTASEFDELLGRSAALWRELRVRLAGRFGPVTDTWRFYKHWTLQVRHKKHTVAWMTPRAKHFLVSTAYGEKAARAASASDLPKATKQLIASAQKYAEGRAVRIEVRFRRDLPPLLAVLEIKAAS